MSLPRTVLFANDFSKGSRDALPYALSIAKRTDATLHIAYVDVLQKDVFTNDVRPSGPVDKVRSYLKNYIGKQYKSSPYDPESLRVKHHVIRGASASWVLVNLAREQDADLIVMGTQGRGGASKLLLGSVASEVVRTAPCDVLTVGSDVSHPTSNEVREILAPVDFSEASATGLEAAREWAKLYGARLNVFIATYQHIHPDMHAPSMKTIYDVTEEVKENMTVRLKNFYREVGGPEVDARLTVETGDAGSAIKKYMLRHEPDMVILATHGHTGFRRFALGSVTEKMIRLATCPVLTVRPKRKDVGTEPDERFAGQGM